MDPKEELESLRRLHELESKASAGNSPTGNTVPVPYKPIMGLSRTGSMFDTEEPEVVDYRPDITAAAKGGVDVNSDAGLPAGIRFRAGVATDPSARMNYYAPFVAQKFGYQGKDPSSFMRLSPYSNGSVEFLHPRTGNWTPVDSYGPTAQDAPSAIQNAALLGISAGTAALTGGAPMLGQFGAAAGAGGVGFAGLEDARNTLARNLGVPEAPLTWADHAKNLGVGAALEAGPIAAMGTYRIVKGWFNGWKIPFNDASVQAMKNAQLKYQNTLTEINNNPDVIKYRQDNAKSFGYDNWEDFKYNPRADQFMEGLGTEASSAAADAAKDPTTRKAMAIQAMHSNEILNVYLKSIQKPFEKAGITGAPGFAQQAGRQAQAGLDAAYADNVGVPVQKAASDASRAANITRTIPEGSPSEGLSGGKMRDATEALGDKSWEDVTTEYGKFKSMIGEVEDVSPHSVEFTPELIAFRDKMQRLADNGIIPEQAVPLNRLGVKGQKSPAGSIVDESGKPLIPEGPETVNLSYLQDAIKRLRMADKKSGINLNDIGLDKKERWELIKKLTEMRDGYLEHSGMTEALDQIHLAERTMADYGTRFRNGFVGKMLRKDIYNTPAMENADIVKAITTDKNGPAMQSLISLAKDSPELMNELRQVAFANYRKEVMKDGVNIDPELHRQYMDNYKDVIGQLFTGDQRNLLNKAGGFASLALSSQKKAAEAVTAWKSAMGGKLQKLDNFSLEGVVRGVFEHSSSPKAIQAEDLYGLKGILDKYTPSGWKSLQAGVGEQIRRSIITDGRMNSQELDKMLANHGNEITAVMGKGYVENLKLIKSAAENLDRGSTLYAGDLRSLAGSRDIQAGVQVVEGPLSRGGKLMNVGIARRQRAMATKIYDALTDPEELSQWAGYSARRTQAFSTAHQLGVGAYDSALVAEDQRKK